MGSGFVLAALAGTCASLASVSSKLALEEGGKTLRYIVPCAWMTELQCINVRTLSSAHHFPLHCHALICTSYSGLSSNPCLLYHPHAHL